MKKVFILFFTIFSLSIVVGCNDESASEYFAKGEAVKNEIIQLSEKKKWEDDDEKKYEELKKKALDFYVKASDLEPKNVKYNATTAFYYKQIKNYKKAIEYYNKAIDNSEKPDCGHYIVRAETKALLDGYTLDSEKDFDKAIEFAPSKLADGFNLKKVYKRRKENAKKRGKKGRSMSDYLKNGF